ncbi:MAG: hypothetical protein AAFN74_22160 [Myxococcota bacterium]
MGGGCLASVVLAATAGAADAHPGHFHRRLLLEADDDRVLVVFYLEATKERRAIWRAMADSDRDGRLSPKERAHLERGLAEQATEGIRMSCGAKPRPLQEVQTKMDLRPKKPLAVMALAWIHTCGRGRPVTVHASRRTRPISVGDASGFSRQLSPGRTVDWPFHRPKRTGVP